MSLLLGVDVGTTNIKAVLYDSAAGRVLATAARPMVVHHPRPDWSEFEPAEIWAAVVAVVRAVQGARARRRVAALAVASMGEAGVAIDAQGDCLCPIVAWFDPRSEPFVTWWAQHCDPQWLYEITGLAPRHIYGLNKLLWLREQRPAVFQAMRHWLSVADFLIWRLAGVFATDYSIASRTMAFDQRLCAWSKDVLAVACVPEEILPTPLQSGTSVGRLTESAASATGLAAGTVVVAGGHDHVCAALAAGLLTPGTVLDSTGTAQAVLAVAADYHPSPRLRGAGLSYYHHVARGRYVLQGGLSAAGGALAWLAMLLSGSGDEANATMESLLAEAAASPAGSNGAIWLPHLLGSGTPENDPDSRAAVLGLNAGHTRGDLVRSLLEALCYSLRQNVELLADELRTPVRELIAVGGATRSAFWLQLKADVTGRSVRVPQLSEATAVGAALLAGIGAGVFPDEEAAVRSLTVAARSFVPDPDRAQLYRTLYEQRYLTLHPLLSALNHAVAQDRPRGE